MAVAHTVWSLDEKKPLETASLIDEKELELLLRDSIEILSKEWLVIGNQVKTASGKYIDLLCIDHDGSMVVVELKKDMTPREVTAQVIDYAASVSKLTVEEIAQIYLSFSSGTETLNDAFQRKFGETLDENSVNQNVKMVIVASKMDDGTERIIHFLRDVYRVDINILFFRVFQNGNDRLISRVWFEEDLEDSSSEDLVKKASWNGEYYASFGGGSRRWEDARKYGFISAGGRSWYSKTLMLLHPGDRIWVNVPHVGYVGVGIVTEEAKQAENVEFEIEGTSQKMTDISLLGNYFYATDDPEKAEFVVKVKWIKTVPTSTAVKELGFFGNQNSVCRPVSEKWDFTIRRLKKCWDVE